MQATEVTMDKTMDKRSLEYAKQVGNILALLNATEQAVKDAVALRAYWQPAEMAEVAVLWKALTTAKKAYAEGLAQLPL